MTGLFFEWYFLEIPRKIKKIWGNYLWFFGRYFALAEMGKDFFAPWKGLVFAREKRGFEISDAFSAWFGNMISRILGAIMRLFFLGIGLVFELAALAGGILAYVVWLVLIPLIFYCFWKGLALLL